MDRLTDRQTQIDGTHQKVTETIGYYWDKIQTVLGGSLVHVRKNVKKNPTLMGAHILKKDPSGCKVYEKIP